MTLRHCSPVLPALAATQWTSPASPFEAGAPTFTAPPAWYTGGPEGKLPLPTSGAQGATYNCDGGRRRVLDQGAQSDHHRIYSDQHPHGGRCVPGRHPGNSQPGLYRPQSQPHPRGQSWRLAQDTSELGEHPDHICVGIEYRRTRRDWAIRVRRSERQRRHPARAPARQSDERLCTQHRRRLRHGHRVTARPTIMRPTTGPTCSSTRAKASSAITPPPNPSARAESQRRAHRRRGDELHRAGCQ